MPEDWRNYVMVKSYLFLLDNGLPITIENMGATIERMKPEIAEELSTVEVKNFIAVENQTESIGELDMPSLGVLRSGY